MFAVFALCPEREAHQLLRHKIQFRQFSDVSTNRSICKAKVVVEYLNPSFLVKKKNGGFRLVTAFTDVGRYSKPQPSPMPDMGSTLLKIACWKYIMVSVLSQAFYQIPLAKNSMKYCGVFTPFKGVCVYTHCATRIPHSETALEEQMCRVLGDLLQEGRVAKIAHDLYHGGNSIRSSLQTGVESSRLWIAAIFASPLRKP